MAMSQKKVSICSTNWSDQNDKSFDKEKSKYIKKVTFKEDLVQIILVDKWSDFNKDFSKIPTTAWGFDHSLEIKCCKKKVKKQSNYCGDDCIII